MAWTTRRSTAVVEWLSMKIGSFTPSGTASAIDFGDAGVWVASATMRSYLSVVALSIEDGDRDIEVPGLVTGVVIAGRGRRPGRGLPRHAGQPGEQPRRLALLMTVVIAHAARGRRVVIAAGLARVQVRERLAEVVLDHLQLHDLLADLGLLLGEQRADPRGRLAPRVRVLEVSDEALDLGEGEPDRLQLDDPVDAVDRLGAVQPEAALRPGARLQQAQLLIEVHRADGLADRLGELSDPHQLVGIILGHRDLQT